MKQYLNRPCADCGEPMINPQPARIVCLDCRVLRVKARAREQYRDRIAGEAAKKPRLNCLQCRHCALLPQTDFTNARTPIYCNAVPVDLPVGERAVNLGGCAAAEPMKRNRDSYNYNEVAGQFIRDLIPIVPPEKRPKMARLLGKSEDSIKQYATRYQIKFPISRTRARKLIAKAQLENPRIWPGAQRDFIQKMLDAGKWPGQGGKGRDFRTEQMRKRLAIISGVKRYGPPRSWEQIKRFAYRLSPGYKRAQLAKSAR